MDHLIAILLNHRDQTADRIIQSGVFSPSRLIHILNGNRVSQFIICQKISVPVENIASRGGQCPLFSNLELKVIVILLSLNDLELKDHGNQITAHAKNHEHQNEQPRSDHIHEIFFKSL